MTKKSRKYCKLQYIRKKNHVRLGGLLFIIQKVSRVFAQETPMQLQLIIQDSIACQSKKLKLPLTCMKLEQNYCNDDFARDLVTFKITVKYETTT